ncbi:MAG: tyrosine-type recombinase/integrase [Polyangiales bacterium]
MRTTTSNVEFLEDKARPLVTLLGNDLNIAEFREPAIIWRYIDERRQMRTRTGPVSDRTIKRELGVLRMALAMAKSRGSWSGDLDLIVPADFKPTPTPKGDSISRSEALRIFPRLSPDSSAAMAFALASGAEMSALLNALRADIPDDLKSCTAIMVRGTKNAGRTASVPIVTDEQRILLAHAREFALGEGDRLFGELHRLIKELHDACEAEGITVISPHDLRRSAGQWMVDLSVPIELVSKFMRHADTHITETIYASVRREAVGDRILDAIDRRYAQHAHRGRKKPLVETLTAIPVPRRTRAFRYIVDGVGRTLSGWAEATGISKTTLHYRVVVAGKTMAQAISKGRASRRSRAERPANDGSAPLGSPPNAVSHA